MSGGSASEVTRLRAIDAARALAVEGGMAAVRIRDVSRRSGIAEHELYLQFSSSEHLMVMAQHEWVRRAMEAEPLPVGPGIDGGDRVAELVRRSFIATREAPRFVAASLASLSSMDPAVLNAHHNSNREVAALIRSAVEGELDDPDEYIEVFGVAWLGVLSAWILGNIDVDKADCVAQRTARLLFRSVRAEQANSDAVIDNVG